MGKIANYTFRGYYPTYNYDKFLIDNKGNFPVHKISEGYRKPIVEYDTVSNKRKHE